MYPWEAPELRRQIYENREISWLRFNYRVLGGGLRPLGPPIRTFAVCIYFLQ